MIVGEAPGEDEDIRGIPFIGKAGGKLDSILDYVGVTRDEVYITNSVLCLYPNALVYLPDGSSKRISQLAAEEYRGSVLSFDEQTETFIAKNVTAIHRNKLGNRKWLKVSYSGAKKNAQGIAGVVVTDDHEFLTDYGWISAYDIMVRQNDPYDHVSINIGPEAFNTIAYEIALGTILGDATISNECASLTFSHADNQKEWANLKARAFGISLNEIILSNRQNQWRGSTAAMRQVAYWRDEFYATGKKQIPSWMTESMTPLMLATWFCDDGYTRVRQNHGRPLAEIATCAFDDQSVDVLMAGIHRLGIESYVRKTGKQKQYNRICFTANETEKLLQLIAPYVPDCLAYKVPGQNSQGQLINDIFVHQPLQALYCRAIVEEASDSHYKNKTTYCLEVKDTHNFVTPGGVVHNCRPPLNRNPRGEELDACKWRLDLQISLLKPKLIILLGKIAMQQMNGGAIKGALSQFFPEKVGWKTYKVGGHEAQVMVSYHPSYHLRSPERAYRITLPHWQKVKKWVDGERQIR